MTTPLMITLIVISSILFILILNYAIFRRSFTATIVEIILWLSLTKLNYKKAATKTPKQQSQIGHIPQLLGCTQKRLQFQNMPLQVVQPKKKKPTLVILFLHGGAYIKPAKIFHWLFIRKLAKRLNAAVVVPLYPLAPQHTYKETYPTILNLYKKLLELKTSPILMGDSAGGGLAAAICMSLAKEGVPQPAKTILLSPWVDVTMTNPKIPQYECKDPMLEHTGAIAIGKLWAGDLFTTDYKVSPTYGDCNALKDTYIFVGTREILYPDIIDFYKKCNANTVHLWVQRGMNHDYPLFPIPEACASFKMIRKIINNND